MNFIVTNFSAITDVLKGIFGVIFLITSFSLSQSSYSAFIKRKNKNIQLKSRKVDTLKLFLYLIIWFPIQIFVVQLLLMEVINEATSFYIVIALIMIVFMITYFFYLENLNKENKIKDFKFRDIDFLKKVQCIWGHIFIILIFLLCTSISILLSVYSDAIISDFKGGINNEFGKYFATYISFYIMNVYVGVMVYYTEKSNLKRYVKEVRIFYVQNNKQKVELDIKYEDFNINKEFIVYYSSKKRYNVVVPTKDLLRIEYYYYE